MSKPTSWLEAMIESAHKTADELLDALGVKVVYVAPECRHEEIVCTPWLERERARA